MATMVSRDLTLVAELDPWQVLPKTIGNFQGRLAGAATSDVMPTSRAALGRGKECADHQKQTMLK